MAYEIKSESYGRRLPKITATADSTDDLASLGTNWAEGSTCVISDTTYKLDKVKGWVDPSSGGGGASLPAVTSDDNGDVLTVIEGEWSKGKVGLVVNAGLNEAGTANVFDKTWSEVYAAFSAGLPVVVIAERAYNDTTWEEADSVIYAVEMPVGIAGDEYRFVVAICNESGNIPFKTTSGDGYPEGELS